MTADLTSSAESLNWRMNLSEPKTWRSSQSICREPNCNRDGIHGFMFQLKTFRDRRNMHILHLLLATVEKYGTFESFCTAYLVFDIVYGWGAVIVVDMVGEMLRWADCNSGDVARLVRKTVSSAGNAGGTERLIQRI